MVDSGRLQLDGELSRLSTSDDFSFALIDLEKMTVFAISPAALLDIGLDVDQVVGRPVLNLFVAEDRDAARQAVDSLRAGVVDSYWAHRTIARDEGDSEVMVWLRVRAVEIDGRRMALSEINRGEQPRPIRFAPSSFPTAFEIVAGVTDSAGNIVSLSRSLEDLSDLPRSSLLGSPLVRSDAQIAMLRTLVDDGLGGKHRSVLTRIQLGAFDKASSFGCVVSTLAGTSDLFFMVVPLEMVAEGAIDAAGALERRTWRATDQLGELGRIAEIRNVLGSEAFAVVDALSTRQWEVVRRMLHGKGVRSIAADLSVSPSTIRNTLSSIYKKLGVHGQSELLELIIKLTEPSR